MPQEPASTPTALIIGGCKGIGRAIAARLARDGFDILASSRQDSQDVVATAELVHQAGRQFTLLTFDVGNREQCRAALAPLLLDRSLAARLGAAGRAAVVERFSLERMAAETAGLYRDVLAAGNRGIGDALA